VKEKAALASTYTPCPDVAQLMPSTTGPNPEFAPPAGWTVQITRVEWWIPNTTNFQQGAWTTVRVNPADPDACMSRYNTCPEGGSACDPGFQRVSFRATNARTDYAASSIDARVLTRRRNV
jgi:hypothetical protein